MSMFISEFGEAFTSHTKQKLMEIRNSCILIRKAPGDSFDIKHVEHTKHILDNADGTSNMKPREYTFGQLLINEDLLYFSKECEETEDAIQHPAISDIYSNMDTKPEVLEDNIEGKRIEDSNVDYLVDHLTELYPPLSEEYLKIIGKYKRK